MVNAIDNRCNQATFDVYAKMESVIAKCLNCQDYSTELHFPGTNYGEDVDDRALNVQLGIYKVLKKDGAFTCLDDILVKIKELNEAEKCMISEIITLCNLLLVNPATSGAGERSFSSARRLKTRLGSTMTQTRFSNRYLTILNTHKQRTDKLYLIDVANEFSALNENRKSNFGTFRKSRT